MYLQKKSSRSWRRKRSIPLKLKTVHSGAPDGGWGWVVVFASFMVHFITDGVIHSLGVFYVAFLRYFGTNKTTASLVASILLGVAYCTGPFTSGLTNRYGCRIVSIMGSFIAAMGFISSMFVPKIEYLFITIGMVSGFGFGLLGVPSVVSVSCYFEKRRATATGLALCGSGIGTFILAPFIEFLIDEYEWQGAMLIVAGIILNCLVFSSLYRPINVTLGLDQSTGDITLLSSSSSSNISSTNTSLRRWEVAGLIGEDFFVNFKSIKNQSCPLTAKRSSSSSSRLDGSSTSTIQITRMRSSCRLSSRGDPIIITSMSPSQPGLLYRDDILYSGNVGSSIEEATKWQETILSVEKDKMKKRFCCSTEIDDTVCKMVDLTLMKDPIFITFAFSNFLTSVGYNVPYVYIVDRAVEMNISNTDYASLFLSVIGMSSTVGRVLFCLLTDRCKTNRLTVYTVCLLVSGFSTILSSMATNYHSMVVYCIVFGLSTGACISLMSLIVVDLLGMDKLTNAYGLVLLFIGLSSFAGPPITGWFYEIYGSYNAGFYAAGISITTSGLILFSIPIIKKRLVSSSESSDSLN